MENIIFYFSGMHFHGNCNSTAVIKKILNIIKESSSHLYCTKLQVTKLQHEVTEVPTHQQKKGWGGWGDIRDQELCLKYVKKN